MLTASQLGKSYGDRTLFEDVSLQINRGDRIALVGSNGAGKSTLFSILMRDIAPDTGTVSIERSARIGFLAQENAAVGEETVLDLATAISLELAQYQRTLRQGESSGKTDTDAYHEAQGKYAELGGYQLEPKAKRILKGLAFRESDFDRPAKAMSGGWIMRAHLARLLVMEPDLLMLDEPTNHLDLESLLWFQTYLKNYPGAILMISHDRAFLNALIDGILEIRNKAVHRYRGNYDDYVQQRAAREAQHLAAYKNQQKEIESLQRFADRFRAKASKATQAQSKLKQIERMEKIEAPESSERTVRIRFPQPARSGLRVITLEDVHHAYGDLHVYRGLHFQAERGERIVLVGPNGAGKSTLLKLLAGVLPVQQGSRILGHNTQVGYFSQNRVDTLNPSLTVLEEVMGIPKPVSEQMARTVLGSFLFTGDDVFKRVSVLSGGEKTRLSLVKILLHLPNLLLMDEPTTHLDMASIDALVDALQQYEGTLIFISHDVHFIRCLARKVLHISAGQLTSYAGDYDYYLDRTKPSSEREGLVAGEKLSNFRPAETPPDVPSSSAASTVKTKEQKRREAEERQTRSRERKKLQAVLDVAEKEIEVLEQRQKEITGLLEDPECYKPSGNAMALNRESMEVTDRLEAANQQWVEAAHQLEKLNSINGICETM